MKTRALVVSLALLLLPGRVAAEPPAETRSPDLANAVRTELLRSWRAYEQYAWGHDELQPLSKTPKDWYGESLLMTPVDSLDTLLLMGLDDEAKKARALIDEKL